MRSKTNASFQLQSGGRTEQGSGGYRRSPSIASAERKSVKLIFGKSNIDIVANTPEVGEAKESLPVMYNGREFSIAFNPEFLMAPLRNLSEEEIYLGLIDEVSPGVIKIAGPFLYVLMPVRLWLKICLIAIEVDHLMKG
jgi:DNA polymerase-3 subunit beta